MTTYDTTTPDVGVDVTSTSGHLAAQDSSYQTAVIVCAAVTAFIGTVFVALRVYTRWWMLNLWGWEDWMIVLALGFGYATSEAFIQGKLNL